MTIHLLKKARFAQSVGSTTNPDANPQQGCQLWFDDALGLVGLIERTGAPDVLHTPMANVKHIVFASRDSYEVPDSVPAVVPPVVAQALAIVAATPLPEPALARRGPGRPRKLTPAAPVAPPIADPRAKSAKWANKAPSNGLKV